MYRLKLLLFFFMFTSMANVAFGFMGYVSNINDVTVSVIDSTNETVVSTITVGGAGVFDGPGIVGITPDGTKAYVPTGPNLVAIVDTFTNSVITTLTVGNSPIQSAVTPDGTKVYIPNFDSNDVSVIDTASNSIIATISVGGNPNSLAITPDSTKVYTANFGSGTVSVIDTATNTVIKTITVFVGNSGPNFIVITPDGSKAYVTNYTVPQVSVIDTASNTIISTVSTGSTPALAAVTPDGTKVYVVNQGDNTVSVIDTSLNTVIATIPVGVSPFFVEVTSDGTKAYVANNGETSVSVIDTGSNTVIATVPVGSQPSWVEITPDSAQAFVANYGSNNVTVIDVISNTVIITIPVGNGPFSIVFDSIPQIRSVSPTSGSTTGGNSVTITGINFNGATAVLFGSVTVTSFIVNSDSSITAIVPAEAAGTIDVRVQTPYGTSVATSADQYTFVVSQPLPPSNFIGMIKKNKFLNKTECMLETEWNASPSANVVLYRIYKKGKVVEEISATSPLVFITCLRHCSANGYEITAVNSNNIDSNHVKLRIVRE